MVIIIAIIITKIMIFIITIIVIVIVTECQSETNFLRLYAECRYEVQGEYVIPPDTHIPDSAASMAPMELMLSRSGAPLKPPKSSFGQATGRWRLQVRPLNRKLCALPIIPYCLRQPLASAASAVM